MYCPKVYYVQRFHCIIMETLQGDIMLTVLQMVPHIMKNTKNLVTVMGEKAKTGEAFNIFQYVKYRCLLALANGHTA